MRSSDDKEKGRFLTILCLFCWSLVHFLVLYVLFYTCCWEYFSIKLTHWFYIIIISRLMENEIKVSGLEKQLRLTSRIPSHKMIFHFSYYECVSLYLLKLFLIFPTKLISLCLFFWIKEIKKIKNYDIDILWA